MGTNKEVKNEDILRVDSLTVGFKVKKSYSDVVNHISFKLQQGEVLGIVGESGSGKTMTALSIMGLLAKEAKLDGRIVYKGLDLVQLKGDSFRKMKGNDVAMIFQEPMTSLNPLMTIGAQMDEMLYLHQKGLPTDFRKKKIIESLNDVGLDNGEEIYIKYPHQLSGGMRQRVMIAMAMINEPNLLIADEPTTALDVTIQAQILQLIKKMNQEHKTSVILISHDLGVVKSICDRVLVMQNGDIVEAGTTEEIFQNPREEYTKLLLKSVPEIEDKDIYVQNQMKYSSKPAIKLSSLESNKEPEDSSYKVDLNDGSKFQLNSKDPILSVKNLEVSYEDSNLGSFKKVAKRQVIKKVSLTVEAGECFGIVGESGSGKSTLAKAVLGLITDSTGEIKLLDKSPQMVFQDPSSSLNPSKKVNWILEEPLRLKGGISKEKRLEKVGQILERIGLNKEYGQRYLRQLSGGQRQRVAIGVALIQESKFIILDEPVSALDVTIQAQILLLLKELQKEFGLTFLFISHDLKVIYQMCDRVGVMKEGQIVENRTVKELFYSPLHPYTQKLLEAVL
ncbi:MAG: gsiA [Anaerocolumna sp.]|nr:gsiA [Anaerocolumna sp.]